MKEFQKKKNPIQRKGKIVSIADARDRVGATTEQLILENRERVTWIEKWSKGEEWKKERKTLVDPQHDSLRDRFSRSSERRQKSGAAKRDRTPVTPRWYSCTTWTLCETETVQDKA